MAEQPTISCTATDHPRLRGSKRRVIRVSAGRRMKHVAIFFALVIAGLAFASQGEIMREYQQEIMDRRTAEARVLWETMKSEGFTEDTVAALDFVFFSDCREGATQLIDQLSENYSLELVPANEQGYFMIRGTTRPYGNEFAYEQWMGWIEFIVDVGFSHKSVFSTWSVYSPETKKTWSSETVEVH